MTLEIDTTTEFGQRVRRRLEHDELIWLTTVDAVGRPSPSLVWFLYEPDGTVLVYSQPNKPKVRNIAQNAAVALNFNSSADGGDMIVVRGAAKIDESTNPPDRHDGYLDKYREGIRSIGMTVESFAAEYCVPIRIVLERVRGH